MRSPCRSLPGQTYTKKLRNTKKRNRQQSRLEMNPTISSSASLLKHFENIDDPRTEYLIEHKLFDIIWMTICAVICRTVLKDTAPHMHGLFKIVWFWDKYMNLLKFIIRTSLMPNCKIRNFLSLPMYTLPKSHNVLTSLQIWFCYKTPTIKIISKY
jgi:hypothetical protein